MKAEIIVALDEPSLPAAEGLMERLAGHAGFYKVGLQLFTAAGPEAVRAVQRRGARVFLDLKLHDIPQTVGSAVQSARALGVDLCTVHLGGGPEMLEAAVEAAGPGMRVLGVSVLTSGTAETLRRVGVEAAVADHVRRLVALGLECGLRGFVASALEIGPLRRDFGAEPLLVIPGIRPAGADTGDQKRVATPAEAARAGANYLVMGRPITRAADPVAAYEAARREIDAA